jgi:hypothetical protein
LLERVCATAFLILVLFSAAAGAADLRITDSKGTEVLLTGAVIDYGGFLAADNEAGGIRVLQGDGLVTVKWVDIESLKFVRVDDSVKPPRIQFEVLLKSGKKIPVALFRQGRMKLSGKTDLGDYSIDLDKVRSIAPVR